MTRRIEYVTAPDRARPAFWTLGRGGALVYLAGAPWNHIELWEVPKCREWYERLARSRMLIRYDVRGTGLSARDVSDLSLIARVGDLETVTHHLGIEQFDLLGAADAGPVAIAYAAKHPERVRSLILWCTWARGSPIHECPRLKAWMSLLDQDWTLMTDTCAHLALGWSAGAVAREAAQLLRESVTKEVLRAGLAASAEVDVTDMLASVKAPTLILHPRSIDWLPPRAASELASEIPHARLLVVEGDSTAPYLDDMEQVAGLIEDFLSETIEDSSSDDRDQPLLLPVEQRRPLDGLTQREAEVLRLIAAGRTNKEIAEELVISVRTVERHLEKIYGKIQARGRAQATAYALTRGLV